MALYRARLQDLFSMEDALKQKNCRSKKDNNNSEKTEQIENGNNIKGDKVTEQKDFTQDKEVENKQPLVCDTLQKHCINKTQKCKIPGKESGIHLKSPFNFTPIRCLPT